MKAITILLLLIIPSAATAHPGGGLIALDANTVIFAIRCTTPCGDWKGARSRMR